MQIDLVAESNDGKSILLGEVEWTDDTDTKRLAAELRRKAENLPFREGRNVVLALWSKTRVTVPKDVKRFTPRRVLEALH
jgi:AAA+ ATPase superfamily predicted ATPase